jgi:hypothetical protein
MSQLLTERYDDRTAGMLSYYDRPKERSVDSYLLVVARIRG